MNRWCETNDVIYISNEELFEFRSGEVDSGSYITRAMGFKTARRKCEG